MFHFERAIPSQAELVRDILTHPRVWPNIRDDFSPPSEDFFPVVDEGLWWVLAYDVDSDSGDRELLGLWLFEPRNGVCWEAHTCLLPNAWGPRGVACAKACIEWFWYNTSSQRIIGSVPASNRLALRFALNAGMSQFGVNPRSILVDGRLHDQILVGISRSQEL